MYLIQSSNNRGNLADGGFTLYIYENIWKSWGQNLGFAKWSEREIGLESDHESFLLFSRRLGLIMLNWFKLIDIPYWGKIPGSRSSHLPSSLGYGPVRQPHPGDSWHLWLVMPPEPCLFQSPDYLSWQERDPGSNPFALTSVLPVGHLDAPKKLHMWSVHHGIVEKTTPRVTPQVRPYSALCGFSIPRIVREKPIYRQHGHTHHCPET